MELSLKKCFIEIEQMDGEVAIKWFKTVLK